MRLKNLTGLVIGQHLVFDGADYRVKLGAAETKTGRSYVAPVPSELTPYVDGWLQVHRAHLQSIATSKGQVGVCGHLWLNRWGRPVHSSAIRHQIETRTEQAFGKAIWPHLFRDCAVTKLVDCAPGETRYGLRPAIPRGTRPGSKHTAQKDQETWWHVSRPSTATRVVSTEW